MTLREFLDGKPKGTRAELLRRSRVSAPTLYKAIDGRPLKNYAKAKAISDATGGAVTVADLCEPPKRRARGSRRTETRAAS